MTPFSNLFSDSFCRVDSGIVLSFSLNPFFLSSVRVESSSSWFMISFAWKPDWLKLELLTFSHEYVLTPVNQKASASKISTNHKTAMKFQRSAHCGFKICSCKSHCLDLDLNDQKTRRYFWQWFHIKKNT